MKFIHRYRQQVIAVLLAVLIIYPVCLCSLHTLASDNIDFLNDRAADIVNARPLSSMDLLIPGGLSGQGQIVGIADSGLDKGSVSDIHPDLQSELGRIPRVVMLKSYSGRDLPDDPVGHGTHMAAAIVGSGAASGGQYSGMAEGASLYFQALLDNDDILKIPDNINVLFTPAYQAGVKTHVNGWGREGNYYASVSSQIDRFVYNYPDFLPLFGAGNSGPDTSSLTCEANSKNALIIGSSQVPRPALSPDAKYADQAASSSSLGPTGDGRIKPELMAPGSAVVSACSSLSESNFTANEMYTLMGGSSMATAVTGGCIALLREYLDNSLHIENPSAALIKALLVNGARPFADGPSISMGFGILDLAGTVLALEEETFYLRDNENIKAAEAEEYTFVIGSDEAPFKATLAWTDPPANSGAAAALVNDLDLVVRGPGGKLYYGNDFESLGQADDKNNMEQVYIARPAPGKYTIRVRGADISDEYSRQKFAVVYGQALIQETITDIDDKQIVLGDNNNILLKEIQFRSIIRDGNTASVDDIQTGSQMYMTVSGDAYIFSSNWEAGGVQMISTPEGEMLLEANDEIREGGYYIAPRDQQDNDQGIMVNGEIFEDVNKFPTGAGLTASVNPVYQTLWQICAAYEEVSGYIASFDSASGKITLIHDSKSYILTDWAAGNFSSLVVDSSRQDAPFGYGEKAYREKLVPGMKVTLMLSPGSSLVNYVKVEREIVVGTVVYIDAASENIRLDTGKVYHLFPGTMVYRNGEEVSLEMLAIGDHVTGLLLPDTRDLLQLEASNCVRYGKIIYCNNNENTMYFIDSSNTVMSGMLTEKTGVYYRGVPVSRTSLMPGSWVRLICCHDNDIVQRVDMADIKKEQEYTLAAYYPQTRTFEMTDGSIYLYENSTLLSKNGYSLMPEDFLSGERVKITTLYAADSADTLAAVEVVRQEGVESPELQFTARSLNGVLIIQGYSTANRISIYREDNSREVIETDTDGQFSAIFRLLENEHEVQVLAINTETAGIFGVLEDIQEYPVNNEINTFSDITDHPAQEQIEELASRGVIQGYEDGTFRPDTTISRVELVKILAEYEGWTPSGGGGVLYTDYNEIPWWALGAVSAASEYGIIEGYPDGSFRPYELLSRSEMLVILDRALSGEDESDSTLVSNQYTDKDEVPSWAIDAVSRGYERGMLQGIWPEAINFSQTVTRGEVAMFLMWL